MANKQKFEEPYFIKIGEGDKANEGVKIMKVG